jgi:hypothetical protein
MNKLSIIILFLAITKYATANSTIPTRSAILDFSHQSKSSEDDETMMDRELKAKSKTKFKRKTPTSNLRIDTSAYSISVKVTDPKGIKKVWILTKYENGKYVSHRAKTKNGRRYKLKLNKLQEGTYTWRVKAKNKRNKKKRSSATSFVVIRKWFHD